MDQHGWHSTSGNQISPLKGNTFTVIEELQNFANWDPLKMPCRLSMPIFVVCALSSGNVLLDRQWVSYLFRFCCFILWMHFVRRKSFFISTFLFNFSLDTGCQHSTHIDWPLDVSDIKCSGFIAEMSTISFSALCDHHYAASVSWQVTIKLDDNF
jgi:hypothetical protein